MTHSADTPWAAKFPFGGIARNFVRASAYPILVLGSLFLLGFLLNAGLPPIWAPYAALACTAPAIILLEHLLPYRARWLPSSGDIKDDIQYAVFVQTLLPLVLAWISLALVQRELADSVPAIWPVQWPIWIQLLTKIAVGDFFRYWLHRAAHRWQWLWRLHAVHHAPKKLYTTNVFRFHPAEKTLQFLCDSLPFILVGIGAEVLSYYFVFYAISGLFQHSNCDVRLGWLNYVVSGPEVHRWHHSRRLGESNTNFAHSFVLWDILFGTYYRPRNKTVAELGFSDPGHPRGFLAQLRAPQTG